MLPGFVPGTVRTLLWGVSYTPSGLPHVDRVDPRVTVGAMPAV